MEIAILTEQNLDQVITANNIVVIDFWAEWCGPCKAFAEIFSEVARQNPDILFGKINVDEQPGLAKDFDIRSIPFVMILKQQVVIFHQAGLLPASALTDLVAQAKALDMTQVYNDLAQQQAKDKD